MVRKTYDPSDLGHSKWKQLRQLHLEDYGYTCQSCRRDFFDDAGKLHIHHGFYRSGARAWEYDVETLWWICAECHGKAHRDMEIVNYHTAMCPPSYMRDLATDISLLVSKYLRMHEIETRLQWEKDTNAEIEQLLRETSQ